MSTFEISENWKVRPATETQRWAPLISTPMAMVSSSSPMLTRYSSHEKVRSQR